MQDMLVPIFGDNGAIIVQYAITLVVIIALIALVVWGMRRYGNSAIRPAARGRLPRLAIVDALPVDNKRKLVLLRRDNVEHLILIGGPSDVVVEPSIVRQRVGQRPGQATASRPGASPAAHAATVAQAASPQPEPAAPPAVRSHETAVTTRTASAETEASAESTIHFPVRRSTSTHAAIDRFTSSRRESGRGPAHASSAHAESTRSYRAGPSTAGDIELVQTATRREPVTARADLTAARVDPRPESRSEPASRFAPAGAVEPPDGPVPGYEPEDEDRAANAFAPHGANSEAAHDSGDAESEVSAEEVDVETASSATASVEPTEAAAADENVGNLEQEMARLLDQISTTRRE